MKIFIKIMIIGIVFSAITAILIVSDGLIDNTNKSDLIVILGNKVELSGLPSLRLQSRLDKGYDLYIQGFAPLILVSGGLGKEGYDEAEVMKNYLINRGVYKDVIITDSMGIDSFNTARNTKQIMTERNLNKVLLISNYYHISRTRLAFKKSGIEKVYSSHARYFEVRDLYSIPREVIGYYYYLFR